MRTSATPIARTIVHEVAHSGPISRNVLMWSLAERWGRVSVDSSAPGPFRRGQIEPSFYSSYTRAVNGLVADGALIEVQRKLESLDEFVALYPSKTRDLFLYEMRGRLLPELRTCPEYGRFSRSFDLADNELFIARDVDEEYRQQWARLDEELLAGMRGAAPDEHHLWMGLLIRGRQLFGSPRGLRCAQSLSQLISEVPSTAAPDLLRCADRIRRLYATALPRNQRRAVRLKSWLRRLVNLDDRGPPHLKDETWRHLAAKQADVVSAMPETRQSPLAGARRNPRVWSPDPDLHRLVDRHALEPFSFLSLSEHGGWSPAAGTST